MDNIKKTWVKPDLHIFGDMQNLTQQAGGCDTAVQKGLGTGDTLQNEQANQNTGCNSSGV